MAPGRVGPHAKIRAAPIRRSASRSASRAWLFLRPTVAIASGAGLRRDLDRLRDAMGSGGGRDCGVEGLMRYCRATPRDETLTLGAARASRTISEALMEYQTQGWISVAARHSNWGPHAN
jgi:hypothetical protein